MMAQEALRNNQMRRSDRDSMAWPREGFYLWATGGEQIKECHEKSAA